MSSPKDKKPAKTDESKTQKSRRAKEKLIRLDDLIPKGNVTGGRQLLFGATDTQQPNNPREKQ
ncbi:MAG: hypothetical protein ACR2NX_06875 [Chthoniobacterales bacterium]